MGHRLSGVEAKMERRGVGQLGSQTARRGATTVKRRALLVRYVTDSDDTPALSESELSALHEAELGAEWLRRAHGSLVEFHHATGHAMDHLHDAESTLREAGHTDLADQLRDELLPSGAIEDRWTYDLLETFEAGVFEDVTGYERRIREELADGERHLTERRQEREWKRRARDRTK